MADQYRPSEADEKVIKRFFRRYDEAESLHARLRQVWRNNERIYMAGDVLPGPEDSATETHVWARQNPDGLSRLYTPFAFQQIETQVPRYLEPDPQFGFKPRTPDGETMARALQKVVDYGMYQDRWEVKREDVVRRGLICGMFVYKNIWVENYSKVKRAKMDLLRGDRKIGHDDEGNLVDEDEERYEVVKKKGYCGPSTIAVSPYHFRWDPSATRIEKARYAFHTTFVPMAELKRLEDEGVYKNVKFVNDSKGDVVSEQEAQDSYDETGNRPGLVTVVEMWTRGRLVTMALDQRVILQDIEMPYWHGELPFVVECTIRNPKSMMGVPEVWAIGPIQQQIWDMDNKQMDAINMALNPPIEYSADEGRAWKDFESIPGERVPVEGEVGKTAQPVIHTDLSAAQGLINSQAIIDRLFTVTGVNEALSGADNSATATQSLTNSREANSRMVLKLTNIKRGEAQVSRQHAMLWQQYMTEELQLRILGKAGKDEWEAVQPEDIQGDFIVESMSSTDQLNKELAKQQAMEKVTTLQPFNGVPLASGNMIDLEQALRDYVSTFDGVDLNKYFHPAPPPSPMPMDPAMGGMPLDAGMVDPSMGMPGAVPPPADAAMLNDPVYAPQPYTGGM